MLLSGVLMIFGGQVMDLKSVRGAAMLAHVGELTAAAGFVLGLVMLTTLGTGRAARRRDTRRDVAGPAKSGDSAQDWLDELQLSHMGPVSAYRRSSPDQGPAAAARSGSASGGWQPGRPPGPAPARQRPSGPAAPGPRPAGPEAARPQRVAGPGIAGRGSAGPGAAGRGVAGAGIGGPGAAGPGVPGFPDAGRAAAPGQDTGHGNLPRRTPRRVATGPLRAPASGFWQPAGAGPRGPGSPAPGERPADTSPNLSGGGAGPAAGYRAPAAYNDGDRRLRGSDAARPPVRAELPPGERARAQANYLRDQPQERTAFPGGTVPAANTVPAPNPVPPANAVPAPNAVPSANTVRPANAAPPAGTAPAGDAMSPAVSRADALSPEDRAALEDTAPLPVIIGPVLAPDEEFSQPVGPSPAAPAGAAGSDVPAADTAVAARPSAAQATLDQIKDLYLTAEAIGEDALVKHFDQLSQRQRSLIRAYFDQAGLRLPGAQSALGEDQPEGGLGAG
jgi:hypothetical protein